MQATRRDRVRAAVALSYFALVAMWPAQGVESQQPGVAHVNGVAYRYAGDAPGGVARDAALADLEPVQALNPDHDTWRASVRQRARHLDDAEIPENIQVSYEGDTPGASRPVTDFSEVMLAIDLSDPDHLLGMLQVLLSA